MRRIAFFINDLSVTGGAEHVSILIANMLTKYYDVTFISRFQSNDSPAFPLVDKVHVVNLFPQRVHGFRFFPQSCLRLLKTLKSRHIQTVIDVDGILDLYTLPIKNFAGVKVISWEHSNFHQQLEVPYRRISRPWAGFSANTIVTLTRQDQYFYKTELKHLRCPVVTIHNPIILPDKTSTYSENSTMILSVGRFVEVKGFDLLIQSAKTVLDAHPSWTWTICGDGIEKEKIEKMIRLNGLENRIYLPGNTNVTPYYESASMVVMTSRHEGLPMVLLEAQAHNLPIVSFDCETGPREIVSDGVNGYLVKPENVNDLNKKVSELIESKSLRIRFSQHAHDNLTDFSPESITRQWRQVIDMS